MSSRVTAFESEITHTQSGQAHFTISTSTLAIAVSQLGTAMVVDHVDERVILAGCGLVTAVYAVGWRIATRKLSLAPSPAG